MKNKLKIAMFGQKQIPSRAGGVEVVVEELSTRMVKLGNDVTCYNRTSDNKIKEYKGVLLKKIFTINIKGLAAVSSSFFATLKCAFGNYDVVHIHAEGPACFCKLLKIFKKRVVVTIHGLDYKRAKWGRLASWYIKQGEKNAVKYADEIIVLSRNVQNYFKETYGRQTVFIPNGVNKSEIIPANEITNKYNLEKDEYILFLGRIVPEKGIEYLIEAYKKCNTNKKLIIAGGSSDTINYFNKIKSIVINEERIKLVGHVEGKVLNELFSNAYIYVLPSDVEGMPLSLLEAMSYGNCCLTSDIEECKEVIEDKGLVFKKSNIDDLKQKLQYLCDNKNIVNKYKNEAELYILNKYNWDKVVNDTLNLYNN